MKPKTALTLSVILFIGLFLIVLRLLSRPAQAAWFDDTFAYRQQFSFTHNADISAERAITFSLDTAELIAAGVMQADCDDTRFTDINGKLLNYQLTGSCDNAATTYEVVFPSVINGTNVGYVYYGNPIALSQSQDVSSVTALTPNGGDPAITTRTNEEKGVGPVAFWKFDEGADNTCSGGTNDTCNATGNTANDGLLSGAAWQSEDMCVSGKCLRFDGSDDVVTVINNNSIDFDTGLVTGVTFEVWFKTNSDGEGDTGQIFQKGTNTFCRVDSESSGNLDVQCSLDLATTDATLNISAPVLTNQWNHLALAYTDDSDDEITIYINGISRGTSTDGAGAPAGTDTNNLLWGGTTTANFHGFLDEAKVYNFERTPAQIKSDATRGAASEGSSAVLGQASTRYLNDGLAGYWKLDETSGDASDSSGNALTLTNNGTTTFALGKFGKGSEHVPASTQYFSTATTITGVKTVSFWTNPDSTTNYYIALTSGASITSSSGTISATGFTSPTIYVNGVISSTIAADSWQHVVVTSETAIDANQFYAGREGTNYYDGTLDEVRVYNRTLSAREAADLYNWAPGPSSFWKLDENTGTTAYDISGNANNGSFVGTPIWSLGKYGSALGLNIDASRQAFNPGDPASGILDFSNTDDFTINVWIKATSTEAANWSPIQKGATNTTTDGYRIDITSGGLQNCRYSDGDNVGTVGVDVTTSGPANLLDGTWHFISCVMDRDGSEMGTPGLYILADGVIVGSDTSLNEGDGSGNTSSLSVGEFNANNEVDGYIDQPQIYRYSRTLQQITEDMNAGHPAGGSPVGSQIAYYKFDEQQGTTINNSIPGQSLNGTASVASWLLENNCKMNGCFYLLNSTDFISMGDTALFDGLTGFTTTFWLTPMSPVPNSSIITKNHAGQKNFAIVTDASSTDEIRVHVADTIGEADNTNYFLTSNLDLQYGSGKWQHIAVVYDAGATASERIKVYKNGRRISGSVTGTIPSDGLTSGSTSSLKIGNDDSATYAGLVSQVDELKFYLDNLSEDQIKADFNAGSSVSLGGVLGPHDNEGFSGNPPVAWWNLDENTATTAKDTSGNENTGTLTNSPTWTIGKMGSGLNFAGSNQHVTIADNSDFDFAASSPFTISTWFKHGPASATETLVAKLEASGTDGGYKLKMESDGDITCETDDDDADTTIDDTATTTAATYDDSSWHHIACVYDTANTDLLVYIDGVLTASDTTTTTNSLANDDAFFYGIESDTGSEDWVGDLDQLKIFNYALSQAQVAYDYNRGAPLAHYKFDECQGATAYNSALNGNGQAAGLNGTINPGDSSGDNDTAGTCNSGTSTEMWNDGTTGKRNSSLGFDGTNDYVEISDNANLRFDDTSADFSLFVWVKRTTTGTEYIISKEDADDDGWRMQFDAGNTVTCSVDATDITSSTTITDTNWHHVGCTVDRDGNGQIYIDGKPNGSGVSMGSDSMATTSNIRVGTRSYTSTSFLSGIIDEVRIYNYVVPASLVKQIYTNGAVFFGPETGSP